MAYIGIVGSDDEKFGPIARAEAREIIRGLLPHVDDVLVSGHCPKGGIDIWAEEEAQKMGRKMVIFPPKTFDWPGFKARNIEIAAKADIVHCITLARHPDGSRDRWPHACYHCRMPDHIVSGGCWTMRQAMKEYGKRGILHVLDQR